MKLVELLADKLVEWPENTVEYVQGDDGCWPLALSGAKFTGYTWMLTTGQTRGSKGDVLDFELASDYKTARVTQKMWQAERDRQKGGEWKRHRGGKQPVEDGVSIEVRHRDGEIVSTEAGSKGAIRWKHTGQPGDIMAFRIISQPQSDEVEEIGYQETVHPGNTDIYADDESEGEVIVQYIEAKTDQMETPFKWRDEVTELNAYIEKFTRERDALIDLLASEGFALIPAMAPVMGAADINPPFKDWQVGDIVEVINISCFANSSVKVGDQYPISHRDSVDVKGPVGTFGDEDNYKFIRRQ
jgi:hypothetical protein